MTPNRTSEVIDLLWPGGDRPDTQPVFALLDGARDRRIEPMVRLSKRQYRCLYSGVLTPRLSAAAPYLIFLARDSAFTRELIDSAWGRHWGVFVIAERDTTDEQLRRHFRKFLKVRDEDDRVYLFRYYDPRVLGAYVNACTPMERSSFFGPVNRFVTDAPRGGPRVLHKSNIAAAIRA